MKKLLFFLTLLWIGGAVGLWYWNEGRTQHVRFRTVPVRKGDVRATVTATGTIEPEEVVDVGAQVAGEILRFGADPRNADRPISYGTPVDKGTVLAQLDDALFRARVEQSKASLTRAEADIEQARAKLKQAERDYDRSFKLRSKGPGMVSTQDVENSQSNLDVTRAGLAVTESNAAVARANLTEANTNLGYTTIRSPVKGVILDRRVNIGQTVVASLNAPSLFLIAKDLSRLEIWASVNETDIGSVHAGQPVRFTVAAFPGETFQGKVAQTRLNASMVQNVVTYTVAVSVDNANGKLLPYLTARLEFEVEERKSVLLVPKAALRWQPKIEHVAPELQGEYASLLQERVRKHDAAAPHAAAGQAGGQDPETVIWTPRGDFVTPVRVKVGLTDGVSTEVHGEGLTETTPVVVGVDRRDDEGDISSFLPHTRSTEKPADTGDSAKKSGRD